MMVDAKHISFFSKLALQKDYGNILSFINRINQKNIFEIIYLLSL